VTDLTFVLSKRRDWRSALVALRRLLADGDDTAQVFHIMRALNAGSARRNYYRLLETAEGGRLAFEHIELAQRLGDPSYLRGFAGGTVGAHYRDFIAKSGFTADGLAQTSRVDGMGLDVDHPVAWFGRRQRDTHDIWHVLTGYEANEHLGEVCLVGFSCAQTKGLGWGLIAAGAAIKALRETRGDIYARAIWEGFRQGRQARWLPGQDYEALLAEPLVAARARLGIGTPRQYLRAQALARANGVSFGRATSGD
jgi:ubiquinone biosynthesis protein COQ4